MSENSKSDKTCVVIGASHAGVNFAFALRREGWEGNIVLYDVDPEFPYHRPPLSKTYLTSGEEADTTVLKSVESYDRDNIELCLGTSVSAIHPDKKSIVLGDGKVQAYTNLVIATGARAFIPPIKGIDTVKNLFAVRTLADISGIRNAFAKSRSKKVIIIGGGYIGLETAASLNKLGAQVEVLEREERILARVTAPEMSVFFQELHAENGVAVFTSKNVISIETQRDENTVVCSDGARYGADIVIVGVGIHVNKELAEQAGLVIENGIRVDETAKTSDDAIYAIGDCTIHYNPHYERFVRLESVQNAVDQAKVAAAAICEKEVAYDAMPWFWSDQYDVKLQIVGLSEGYDNIVIRKEEKEQPCFSIWYFNGDKLLSVDAINNAKAYVFGTKFIKTNQLIDKIKLADASVEFKPTNFIVE